jgi:response regulator RpfG family c-di-GMP phosphodiesterase
MSTKILCVDDDSNILAAYQRSLRKQFSIETALGGESALGLLQANGPYAVVVADMNMPGMNGIQFLTKTRELAPDTVRFMLTGNADQPTAISAVNQGHVFQFLTKPCPPEILARALETGVKQYRLIVAERELLEQTLNGSIKMLMDVLSMADPQSFGLGQKLRDYVRTFAESLNFEKTWEMEIAGMLSHIGYVTVPPQVMHKHRSGFGLTGPEKDMLQRVPEIGSKLVANIPRLETVAQILLFQAKHYDGSGFPPNSAAGEDIPVGARILKVFIDLVQLESKGLPRFKALEQMRARVGWYDPKVLDAAFACFDIYLPESATARKPSHAITLKDLKVGHTLASNVENNDGIIIVVANTIITQMVLEKLCNFAELGSLKEPIHIENKGDMGEATQKSKSGTFAENN